MATTDKPEDVEVRLADQEKINEFGRLNNRLLDIKAEVKQAKADHEKLKDASSELEMVIDGKIMLFIGESFIETDEEYAQEYCEKKRKQLQDKITGLESEEKSIVLKQEELKKELYGRFGDSINLES